MGASRLPTPQVFEFHDYREYLLAWLEAKKSQLPKYSLRKWAGDCGLSPSYMTMILKGERRLSPKASGRLQTALDFSEYEKRYFECLVTLQDSASQDGRKEALDEMQKFGRYKANHSDEVKFYQYLSKWYYTAIREMAETKDFLLDAQWIQDRLVEKVAKKDIEKALKFLVDYKFILPSSDGGGRVGEQRLQCSGSVHKLALAEAHKEMFDQAVKSVDRCPKDERWLYGNTIALAEDQMPLVVEILKEANQKIANLEKPKETNDTVFHTGLMIFPLMKKPEGGS